MEYIHIMILLTRNCLKNMDFLLEMGYSASQNLK